MDLREVTFECRDIGYGIETGTVQGHWSIALDLSGAGKRPFLPIVGETLWLFDDEVLSDAPLGAS